jgi:ABC-2 type transport system permease protein
LMVAHYVWVIRSNVAFEEASVEMSKKLAEKMAAARAGKWSASGKEFRRKRAPFVLPPNGLPLIALLWKNLISAGGAFTARVWVVLAVVAISMAVGILGTSRNAAWPVFVAAMAGMFSVWALLLGPQIMRQDFRQDLPNADVLKVFPLRGWQIALGEILAPAVILTGIQWLLLILGVTVALPLTHGKISMSVVLAAGVGAAVILPPWNLVSLIIPNAAVLWFPSWVQTGKEASQGFEAMGQRLIFGLGQFFALGITMIPAGLAFAVVCVPLYHLMGLAIAIPCGALAAAVVMAAEAAFGVMLLGRLFERFDLSAEQTV